MSDFCTDGIAPIDKTRKVKTIVLTTWVFNQLWDLIMKDGIETSIKLKFSSDTYSLKACLRYNQREVCTELDLLV
ncbi:MAG: hypothetical protein VX548_06380 [Bacteroidota bacterium]|nr:hypothetical protein [Bacteroidota bacterium]